MARNKGTFNFAANFQVKMQEALDPRLVVAAKTDLINKETWPYDGDTLYLYEGMTVGVVAEQAVYMLIDIDNALATDYSGWLRVDAGNAKQIEIVDSLTSEATDKALSANQGKILLGKITSVEDKITSIYRVKGSKATYDELPTEGNETGDVWNVEEASNGHPAGTNYVWNGMAWDALGGSIDLSNYYNKSEVDSAILIEVNRAKDEESRLEGLIADNTTLANEAKALASENKTALESVTANIGEINIILNGEDDDDTDGLVGRLATVEEKNNAQDTRLTNLEKLVSGGEAGEGGETLLEMVNANTAAIASLEPRVKANEDAIAENASALEILNADAQTEGSVDYKIEQAFAWEEVK